MLVDGLLGVGCFVHVASRDGEFHLAVFHAADQRQLIFTRILREYDNVCFAVVVRIKLSQSFSTTIILNVK